jgi:hypothetical protein
MSIYNGCIILYIYINYIYKSHLTNTKDHGTMIQKGKKHIFGTMIHGAVFHIRGMGWPAGKISKIHGDLFIPGLVNVYITMENYHFEYVNQL